MQSMIVTVDEAVEPGEVEVEGEAGVGAVAAEAVAGAARAAGLSVKPIH